MKITDIINKIVKSKIFILLLTVIVIYNSGYALSIIDTNKYSLLFMSLPVIFIGLLLTIKSKKISIQQVMLFFLIITVLITFLLYGLNDSLNYISLIIIIALSFLITKMYSFEKFRKYFNNLMFIISIISLIFYYYNNYISTLDLPILKNINDVEYGVAYIFFYIIIVPYRNCGIFWEPGIFATFIILALLFNTIDKDTKFRKCRVVIYILTIITTYSTAGYLLLLLYLLFLLFYSKSNKVSNILFFVLGIFTIFAVYINFDTIINSLPTDISNSFNRLKYENFSNESRLKAVEDNFRIIKNSHGLGVGFGEYVRLSNYVSDTSTMLSFIAIFGIFGIQYTIYWIVGVVRIKKINIFDKVILLIIMFSILNKEPHIFICISWIILFYLLGNNSEAVTDEKESKN